MYKKWTIMTDMSDLSAYTLNMIKKPVHRKFLTEGERGGASQIFGIYNQYFYF